MGIFSRQIHREVTTLMGYKLTCNIDAPAKTTLPFKRIRGKPYSMVYLHPQQEHLHILRRTKTKSFKLETLERQNAERYNELISAEYTITEKGFIETNIKKKIKEQKGNISNLADLQT